MSSHSADSRATERAIPGVAARPEPSAAAATAGEAESGGGREMRAEVASSSRVRSPAETFRTMGAASPAQVESVRSFVDTSVKTDVVAATIYNHLTQREDRPAKVVVALDYNRPAEALRQDLRSQYDQAFRGQTSEQIAAQVTPHRGKVSDNQVIAVPDAATKNRDQIIEWMAEHTANGNGLRIRTTSSAHTALVAARFAEGASGGSVAIEHAGAAAGERQGITVPTLRAVMETRNELTSALGSQLVRERQTGAQDQASELIARSEPLSKYLSFATAAAKEHSASAQLSTATHQLLAANQGQRGEAIGSWESLLYPTSVPVRKQAVSSAVDIVAAAPTPTLEVVIAGRQATSEAKSPSAGLSSSATDAPSAKGPVAIVPTSVSTSSAKVEVDPTPVPPGMVAAKNAKEAEPAPTPSVLPPVVAGITSEVIAMAAARATEGKNGPERTPAPERLAAEVEKAAATQVKPQVQRGEGVYSNYYFMLEQATVSPIEVFARNAPARSDKLVEPSSTPSGGPTAKVPVDVISTATASSSKEAGQERPAAAQSLDALLKDSGFAVASADQLSFAPSDDPRLASRARVMVQPPMDEGRMRSALLAAAALTAVAPPKERGFWASVKDVITPPTSSR